MCRLFPRCSFAHFSKKFWGVVNRNLLYLHKTYNTSQELVNSKENTDLKHNSVKNAKSLIQVQGHSQVQVWGLVVPAVACSFLQLCFRSLFMKHEQPCTENKNRKNWFKIYKIYWLIKSVQREFLTILTIWPHHFIEPKNTHKGQKRRKNVKMCSVLLKNY